jgi:hypothetical protein
MMLRAEEGLPIKRRVRNDMSRRHPRGAKMRDIKLNHSHHLVVQSVKRRKRPRWHQQKKPATT